MQNPRLTRGFYRPLIRVYNPKKGFSVTFCSEWSLVKTTPEELELHLLRCRSWTCELCQPERQRQVVASVISGEPNRFLTLTVNPAFGTSPEDRRAMLAHAWATMTKRFYRLFGQENFQFFAVVEATEAGEPHLHVALRSPYIAQRLLSDWMGELTGSPIVDIRAIKKARDVARYVAKYLGKAPHQFGTFKRYWHSKNYEIDQSHKPVKEKDPLVTWTVDRRPRPVIYREWANLGWLFRPFEGVEMRAWRPPPDPRNARSDLPRTGLMP